jgi:uncharacterized pyridoxamine 5'-phosphate oxidase family protein
MKEVVDLLKNKVFYIATTEGDQPRVRPFGFSMEYEGKLYFCTSNQKNVYHQLEKNPKFELCAMESKGDWLRLSGEAVFSDDKEAKKKAFSESPRLQELYESENNDSFALFYVKEATAYLCSAGGEPKQTWKF